MEETIRNRVAENQNLKTFDLEEHYPEGKRVFVDLSQWLEHGFILREKEYRKQLDEHDWSQYEGANIAVDCTTDAIVPAWAYMLFTVKAAPFVNKVVKGGLEDLESVLYKEVLDQLDYSEYQDKFVIVKGCANKPVPESAYLEATIALQKIARSVMYGEACSSVPLYKRK